MPPKKCRASYCFLLDLHTNNIERVKKVFYRTLVRMSDDKTKSNSQDVYKIVLVGSKTTDNVNGYRNVAVLKEWRPFRVFPVLTDVVEKLEAWEASEERGNLYEGLELALEHILNDQVVCQENGPKNVVVFSDLQFVAPASVPVSALKLSLQEVWLYVAGADVRVRAFKTFKKVRRWSQIIDTDSEDENLKKNLLIFNSIKSDGLVADLEVCAELMLSYVPTVKAPWPWYCDLEIGEHISIKVNVFKLVDDYHLLRIPKDPKKETKLTDYDARWNTKKLYNPNTGEQVEQAQRGYKFKGHYAFLTDEQYKILADKFNDEKCFQLKYFVPYDEVVSNMYFCRNSLSQVVADTRKTEQWSVPLHALAQAMHQLRKAAVFKRVYAKGPQFREMPHLMFVCPDHGPNCLLLARLPYSHEWREDISHYERALRRLMREGGHAQPEPEHSATQDDIDQYLDGLTINHDDLKQHKIFCVPPHLAQNPNLNSQIDYLISNSLRGDLYKGGPNGLPDVDFAVSEREVAAFEMPEFVSERSRPLFERLEGLLPQNIDYEKASFDESKQKYSELLLEDLPSFDLE